MNAFALHHGTDQAEIRRWGMSRGGDPHGACPADCARHELVHAAASAWRQLSAIMVDMAPVSSSPQPTPMDLAPGPVMQQADASPPPEASDSRKTVPEQLAPTPPQEKPGSRGAARAEERTDAAEARTCQDRSGAKAGAR